MHSNPRTLSLSAAARAYGLSRDLLRQAIQRGELPASRPGLRTVRILCADIEAWLRAHRVQPSSPLAARDHASRVVGSVLQREGPL